MDRHEKEKQALVAGLVDFWLQERDLEPDDTPTVKASELAIGDVLEAEDVRWGSRSPARVAYTVSGIYPVKAGKLTISFTSEHNRWRTLTVPANRRFRKTSEQQIG